MDKEVVFYVFSHSQQGWFKENLPLPFIFNQRDLTQPPVPSPLPPSFHSPKRPSFLFFCLGFLTFFFVACSGTSSDKTNSTSNTTDRDTEQECSIQNGEGKKTRSVTEGEEPEAWDNIECVVVTCNEGYTQEQGACHKAGLACPKEDLAKINAYATAGTKPYEKSTGAYGDCAITECQDTHTFYKGTGAEQGACYETTVPCADTGTVADRDTLTRLNANAAQKTYKTSTGDYGDCVPTSSGCKADYTFHNDACYETTVACTDSAILTRIHAKAAEKTYSTSLGDYGDCAPTTFRGCEDDYIFDEGACHEHDRTCSSQELRDLHAATGVKNYQPATNGYTGNCNVRTCINGYVEYYPDRGGSLRCRPPLENKYTDSSGGERNCNTTLAIAHVLKLGGEAVPVTDDNSCPFTCVVGSIKNSQGNRTCDLPSKGNYFNAQGSEQPCTGLPNHASGWANPTEPLASDSCPFTCSSDYTEDLKSRTCNLPPPGYYTDTQGDKQPCTGLLNHARWADPTQPVRSASSCPWECVAGSKKDLNNPVCNFPSAGKYFDAQGSEQDCSGKPSPATWLDPTGPVAFAGGCSFTCPSDLSGYAKKDSQGSTCGLPSAGHYTDAQGNEQPCRLPNHAAHWANPTQPVSSASSCPFTCVAGSKKDTNNPVCNLPSAGKYFNVQGSEKNCSGLPHQATWATPTLPMTSADQCPFTCNTNGHVPDGRTCVPLSQKEVRVVVAGLTHTCAILGNDKVKCWGGNESGQLGLGHDNNRNTPQEVSLGGSAQFLTAGGVHTCAILSDRKVKCWGDNVRGQLGLGNGKVDDYYDTPQEVSLGGSARFLTAGVLHTCAILSNGKVKCWGKNSNGQLGLGDGKVAGHYNTPQEVSLGGSAQFLTAGANYTCAILSNGKVKCWGDNTYGQLGLGHEDERNTPQEVSLGAEVTAKFLTAGSDHTCAMLSNGKVKCWGDNSSGQLGLGDEKERKKPELVKLGGNAQSLAAGGSYTCAILSNGKAKCWGANSQGQLGLGHDDKRNTPQEVNLGTNLTAKFLAAGEDHNCAILSHNSKLKCWGYDDVGELGLGFDDDGRGDNSGEMDDNLPYVTLLP